ncbi:putative leucine-rich repeat protein (LRRP) [Trypanosoma rangeli]|uniref:Putative leucine-rich repeat protein (LRRP) n=1 Tax=Trypanosoma rangeli TaxID=5698 RepID=A0A422NEJ0_TRYRA|nr:putative leucine-rich repeat protein (LRRP) [Trypanosoma rangeli]RNF03869.1 putative leucine-rich repeat protein (LRRP) [Trypanosoma rangeli]|eukprot:RNF03869.1 putative leucine-rich repeat protein (LRRP) [Trypanosoma rangeli]
MSRTPVGTKPCKKVTASAASSSFSSASLKRFLDMIPLDIDIENVRQITLKGKQLTALPTNLGGLLREVRRLELSENDIYDVTPLASLSHLTSLNLSKNRRLSSIAPLATLHLTVCVVAYCDLNSLVGLEGCATTLKTLIANDNNLVLQSPTGGVVADAQADHVSRAVRNYEILAMLSTCETIVLSRNPHLCALYAAPTLNEDLIAEGVRGNIAGHLPHHEADWSHPLSVLEKMKQLKKLSLSGCGLESLPSHWFLPMVTELRLSHNALSSLVPEGVIFRSVKILDVSHNVLTDVKTLRRCRFVRNLSIRGNPFQKETASSSLTEDGKVRKGAQLPVEVLRFLTRKMPHLEVVDSTLLSSIQFEDVAGKSRLERCETVEGNSAQRKDSRHPTESTAEEIKDVVVELSEAVPDNIRAPIVRRERTNLLLQRKRELVADGAAVAQLVKRRKTEAAVW